MKSGFVAGSFDLLHVGHIHLFKECKNRCDKLLVAIQVDPSIERQKKNKPIESIVERCVKVRTCKYVDSVYVYETEADLVLLLKLLKPDIRFLGSDYQKNFRTITEEFLVPIEYIDSLDIHTSDIRRRIKK